MTEYGDNCEGQENKIIQMKIDSKFQKYWRPSAAAVYLSTIIFDYMLRPLINNRFVDNINYSKAIEKVQSLDPSTQAKVMEIMSEAGKMEPVLPENYHIAFGAILGVAAWTRGQEKLERMKKGIVDAK